MPNPTDSLSKYKAEIDRVDKEISVAQEELSRSQGKAQALLEQLQAKFGVDNVKDAGILLESKRAQMAVLEDKIRTALFAIRQKLEGK